jgi:hypothetical protein
VKSHNVDPWGRDVNNDFDDLDGLEDNKSKLSGQAAKNLLEKKNQLFGLGSAGGSSGGNNLQPTKSAPPINNNRPYTGNNDYDYNRGGGDLDNIMDD